MTKTALISGITGQDGSYLAELLIEKGYKVIGLIRRSSSFNTGRIEHLYEKRYENGLVLEYADLTDGSCLMSIVAKYRPDEIYNLGAQSHVQVSFELSEYTAEVDAVGTLKFLNAIMACRLKDTCKFYQASTSELYGLVQEVPQSETTPFYPRSPYAVAKQYAYWICKNYREAYGIFAVNGILFNHESPRRGQTFVTRKVTQAVARIHKGADVSPLLLGNMDAKRDWGHAREYVEGMWRMLQQETPEDFVLATGVTTTVREFVELAFAEVGRTITWQGKGEDEIGVDQDGRVLVKIDPRYFRPTEVDLLLGNPTKAERILGWKAKITLAELVKEMVAADCQPQ